MQISLRFHRRGFDFVVQRQPFELYDAEEDEALPDSKNVGSSGGDFALAEEADPTELMADHDRSFFTTPQEMRMGFNIV